MQIGRRLREARLGQGLTLAALADASRLSKGFLSQVEGGVASPSMASLQRLASALGLPASALLDAPPSLPEGGPIAPAVMPMVVRSGEKRIGFTHVSSLPYASISLAYLPAHSSLHGLKVNGAGEVTATVLAGQAAFRQGAILAVLGAGDTLMWGLHEEYRLTNESPGTASLLLVFPVGVGLPTLQEGPAPVRSAGLVEYRGDGPLKLVEMRAARARERVR